MKQCQAYEDATSKKGKGKKGKKEKVQFWMMVSPPAALREGAHNWY